MLLAMFSLVMFTFFIMLLLATMRIRSVVRKDVPATYYRLMSGADAPDYVTKSSRQLANLFETPLLFYVAGILIVVMDIQSIAVISIAWIYVGLRVVHAAIHLTYNHPIHRLIVFSLSVLCILFLWVAVIMFS